VAPTAPLNGTTNKKKLLGIQDRPDHVPDALCARLLVLRQVGGQLLFLLLIRKARKRNEIYAPSSLLHYCTTYSSDVLLEDTPVEWHHDGVPIYLNPASNTTWPRAGMETRAVPSRISTGTGSGLRDPLRCICTLPAAVGAAMKR